MAGAEAAAALGWEGVGRLVLMGLLIRSGEVVEVDAVVPRRDAYAQGVANAS